MRYTPKILFHVPGEPVAKARARSGKTFSGQTVHYTPAKTKRYERLVADCGALCMAGRPAIEAPIILKLQILMPIPESWPQWKRELAESQRMWPTGKPDADNIEKAIKDGLNGICWKDDSYVISAQKTKKYTGDKNLVGVLVEVLVADGYVSQIKSRAEVA